LRLFSFGGYGLALAALALVILALMTATRHGGKDKHVRNVTDIGVGDAPFQDAFPFAIFLVSGRAREQ